MSREDIVRHYKVDESRMLDKVVSMPDHIEEAWKLAKSFAHGIDRPRSPVIICGMGGSAMGGKLLRGLIQQDSAIPLVLESGYSLPPFAGKDTPVICISYSGNTEEVLSCFDNAVLKKCPTIAITSGGRLEVEAEQVGVPVLRLPGGMPPRAAISYLFIPLLEFFSRWGIYKVDNDQIERATRHVRGLVEKYSLEGDPAENIALELAKKLYGKIPLLYSAGGLLGAVAYRWKCQFNENSKAMAFYNLFPELGHNEVMGWDCPERLREDMFIILMIDSEDHPRVQKRMEVTFEMLSSLGAGGIILHSEGGGGREGRLERLFSLLVLGDFTSVYLAVEYGKDPTPIEKITQIKDILGSDGSL
ncbi:MAG: bifunctional phosphoglucose/phosphomannose isomerase [Candidatus Latescibacteria bacterium 4484_7]|nr:MAG: bifunctional phosphoglucose/phosphomannose isomerase [Candidatus Latescibacteria bacterium 4484_7]RKZ06868.1 MAG: bifunctional phosphoglucose/phosphomannose isomerase [bacterium]